MDASDYLPMFLAESREQLHLLDLAVVRLEEAPDDRATVDEIFRIAHSLKGMSATMGFEGIASLTHELEEVLELVRQRRSPLERRAVDALLDCVDALAGAVSAIETDGEERLEAEPLIARLRSLVRAEPHRDTARPAPDPLADFDPSRYRRLSGIRIDAQRLDQLLQLTGELVVRRARAEALAAQADVPGLSEAMHELTRTTEALEAVVKQVRMVPVETIFGRLPRLVRDLCARLEKQADLVLHGGETELDRALVDPLAESLVHLVRNALDHGLESPERRVAAGKRATGTVEIEAHHAGANVVLTVRDDGRGIDPVVVARRAVARGLVAPGGEGGVTLADAIELLFTPGFSTAEQTTDISGRGVGMDAVRTVARDLGGDVVVASDIGAGTTTEIRLPLTLAALATLVVEVGGELFAVPLDRVERALHVDEDQAEAVVVRTAGAPVTLAVDRVVGRRTLVVRPAPHELAGHRPVSGAAVLPTGETVLIVDCDALAATPIAKVA